MSQEECRNLGTFWTDGCRDFQGQGSILVMTMTELYVAYLSRFSRPKYASLHTDAQVIDVHIDTGCTKIRQIFGKLSEFECHDDTGRASMCECIACWTNYPLYLQLQKDGQQQ